jgi:hypothetical protein
MFTDRRLWHIQMHDVEEIARFWESFQDFIEKVNNVEQYKAASKEGSPLSLVSTIEEVLERRK